MTVWNLGSVNADLFYDLPHLVGAGETIAATGFSRGLGGKGANMSVALSRAGSRVEHIGAVGQDGGWLRDRLAGYGVGLTHMEMADAETGHAIIMVDREGENSIVIVPGANRTLEPARVTAALDQAQPGDWALFQNETTAQRAFAEAAKARGLQLAHAAAPFDAEAVAEVLPFLDLLVMNAVEAAQLEAALGQPLAALPVADIVVTLGADGCRWIATATGRVTELPARKVQAVDTTGAGDTFTGYLVAGLEQGLPMAEALALAQEAGAIMVTRHGTADVIPLRDEITLP